MTVHRFDPRNQSDDAEWWSTVYTRAFPTYESHTVVTDVVRQKQGIDHVVHLAGGVDLNVDVKTREEWYGDVLLEVWSSKEHRNPGWLRKPLNMHYIAYAIPKRQIAYLLPFQLLRTAYERNKHRWAAACDDPSSGIREVHAKNEGYTTVSVAVPIHEVQRAIADAMTVYFDEDMEPFA